MSRLSSWLAAAVSWWSWLVVVASLKLVGVVLRSPGMLPLVVRGLLPANEGAAPELSLLSLLSPPPHMEVLPRRPTVVEGRLDSACSETGAWV